MYQSLELDQIIVLERAIAPDVQLYAILLWKVSKKNAWLTEWSAELGEICFYHLVTRLGDFKIQLDRE